MGRWFLSCGEGTSHCPTPQKTSDGDDDDDDDDVDDVDDDGDDDALNVFFF